jgi:prepilin-type N-terminal cleavage/methylation domain-containing protein
MTTRQAPSGEAGYTLVELLAAMSIGLLIILAAFQIMDRSTQLSKRTYQTVDATQRGRLAMDLMMRELSSQVCISNTIPPVDTATSTAITYFVNLGGADAVPEKHQLSYESNSLVLRRYVGTGTPPTMTWPGTATSTKTLLENVAQTGTTPVFRYYTWGTGNPVAPDALLTAPLSTADEARVAKVAVSFTALPAADFRDTTKGSAQMADSSYVRIADPTDTSRGPRCN